MITPTKKFTLPLSKIEVEIKDWITGQDAEYIDEAIMAGVKVKPDLARKTTTADTFDTKVLVEQAHREIEMFIVAIGDKKTDIVAEATSLPEGDYNFIRSEIQSRRTVKKAQAEMIGE